MTVTDRDRLDGPDGTMFEFDAATAVTRSGSSGDTIIFDAAVVEGWDIGPVANGGYLLAIAGRAIEAATSRTVLTVTAHFLGPGRPGPATVDVTPIKRGRQLSTVTGALRQEGRDVIRVLAACGSPRDTAGVGAIYAGGPPALPPYDELAEVGAAIEAARHPALGAGLVARLALRLRPGDDAFLVGGTTGAAEIAGYFAFADGRQIDGLALLLACDALAPAPFNLGYGLPWSPTIELTAHMRAVPAPGPVLVVVRSQYIADGMFNEDGEVWDSAGRLVAQSRQLALLPT